MTVRQSTSTGREEARSCGECHACCVILAIREPALDKAAGLRCKHLDACGRCSIYLQRPRTCREFRCGWLAGLMPGNSALRPDKLGLMFNSARVADREFLYAWAVWEGASQQPLARHILGLLAADEAVTIVDIYSSDDQAEILGPLTALAEYLPLIGHADLLAAITETAPRSGIISVNLPLEALAVLD